MWTDHAGRHDKFLPGPYKSTESRAAFATLLLERAATTRPADRVAVNELLLAYLVHAEQNYRTADGSPTNEIRHIKTVCRYARELYGDTPAAEFGPLALKAVRRRFVHEGWSRKTVNARIERVRRILKWAAAEELIPPAVHQALAAVAGLQRGRTAAPETEPVEPVAGAVVAATLPFLNRHVRGRVEFQRLTDCRPGEACTLRRGNIDTSGAVWLYRPKSYKTAWKGQGRVIAIGPRAQAVLGAFPTTDGSDYVFSPARAVEEVRAERSASRKTRRSMAA